MKYIDYKKDILGNNYLAIEYTANELAPFLKDLRDILGDDYEEYLSYRSMRDGEGFHITVLNSMEFGKRSKDDLNSFVSSLENLFKYAIDDIKMLGVGSSAVNENTTYYIVCKSDKLDAVRQRYSLYPKDFHITLGFKYKDVFGVRKNEVLEKKSIFIKLLSAEYYKEQNWEFVKNISNFDLDKRSDIKPIQITDSYAKFDIDDNYIIVTLLNDEFKISSQFKIKDKLPKLPKTEINKILKK